MAKRGGNIVLNSYDDLFETQESKEDAGKEKVDTVVIDEYDIIGLSREAA